MRDVTLQDVQPYLRMGSAPLPEVLAARLRQLLTESASFRVPRVVHTRVPSAPWCGASTALARHLTGCAEVYLLVATLGSAFDLFQRRKTALSATDGFIVQAIGTAGVEVALDDCTADLRADLLPGESFCPRFSPGYGDLPLAVNGQILNILDAAKRIGVSETSAHTLVPVKSVTAILGIRAATPQGLTQGPIQN